MFGKDPMKFYPNIQVKIGRFGLDAADLRFHEIIEGNLVNMYHDVQIQLSHKFLIRPITFEGFQRLENDLYPIAALREMLLNSLVHRTYMGATIQMRVYDDHLSIWNEGSLPYGLTLEDLKKEHNSRPRNPLLANACFLGGYIDAWGRGTLKIINACKEAGLPEPEIAEKNGGVSTTLFTHSSVSYIGEKRGEKLSVNRQRILYAMREDPEISQVKLVEIVGIGSTSIEKNIQYLKNNGYIRRVGPAKGGYWQVIDD